jgi:arginine exporter protein ArgO
MVLYDNIFRLERLAAFVGVLATTRDALVAMANILLVCLAGIALLGTEGLRALQWDRPLLEASVQLLGGTSILFYLCAIGLWAWERKLRNARKGEQPPKN